MQDQSQPPSEARAHCFTMCRHVRASDHERFIALVETLPDAVLFKDGEGRWQVINKTAQDLFQLHEIDWRDKTDSDLAALVPDPFSIFDTCSLSEDEEYRNGRPRIYEMRAKADAGEPRDYEVRKFERRSHDGNLIGMVIIVRDITERKATRRALQDSETELRESRAQLMELASNTLIMREEERKAIARELHDELGQLLSALKSSIRVINDDHALPSFDMEATTKHMFKIIDRAIASTRNVVTRLRPPVLDVGLEPTLDWQCRDFTMMFGLPCHLHVIGTIPDLYDFAEVTIFRIVQEALTNIAKHAEATAVHIDVSGTKKNLRIVVRDNGKGMNKGKNAEKTIQHFGILGMRERCHALGGSLEIMSRRGDGTHVILVIPIKEEAQSREALGQESLSF